MRLDKFLGRCGCGSRREVKPLVRSGAVTVNGAACTNAAAQVDELRDQICVQGRLLAYREFVYLMLNKPTGYVSATEDGRYPPVTSLVGDGYGQYDLFPVGRLDVDTTGLLILTNDGAFCHRVLSPKSHVPKTYLAHVAGKLDEADIQAMAGGIALGGGEAAMPAELKIVSAGEQSAGLLTICEGKFHQVKRMFAARGKPVTALKRVRFGGLDLPDDLSEGDCRELTAAEFLQIEQSDQSN